MQATCKGKQELARKTVQKRRKMDAGTQNDAIQEKANVGVQNDACNANGNAMDAMQCSDGLILRI